MILDIYDVRETFKFLTLEPTRILNPPVLYVEPFGHV